MPPPDSEPYLSIVIPTYNEEAILQAAIVDLIDRVEQLALSYEIVIAENGSTDGTNDVIDRLRSRFPQVKSLHIDEANYGDALRGGILDARGTIVVCDEIDLCDVDFMSRAIDLLEKGAADFVVGSKAMEGASDERPWPRRLATWVINALLRVLLGFEGTDTHGLKAFWRAKVEPVARACLVDRDLFASELVIRAQREGLAVLEIPVRVLEKRPPTVGLVRRVPNVLRNLVRLFVAIRFEK